MNVELGVWWGSLDTALRVFYVIGLASAGVLLLQLVAMLFGFDGADDFDADGALDHGSGGSILSVRTVTAFFVGFGWTGVAMLKGGSSVPVATLAGLVVGGMFMFAVFALMRLLYSMQASGTLDYRNAVGEVGRVYVPIGAAMAKSGQVEVMVQGRLRTVAALTRAPEPLPAGARIRVVEVIDRGTLLVEPVE